METPLLLLDVDGTLNISRLPHFTLGQWSKRRQWKHFQVNGDPLTDETLQIHFRRGLPALIHQLEEHFRPVWCSAWNGYETRKLAPRFGFGKAWSSIVQDKSLPLHPLLEGIQVADDGSFETGVTRMDYTPKLNEVLYFIKDRPCVWISAHLKEDAHLAWQLRSQTVPFSYLIPCQPQIGLTPIEVDRAVGRVLNHLEDATY